MKSKSEKLGVGLGATALIAAFVLPFCISRGLSISNTGDCVAINTARQTIQQINCGEGSRSGNGKHPEGAPETAPYLPHAFQRVEIWPHALHGTARGHYLIEQSTDGQSIDLLPTEDLTDSWLPFGPLESPTPGEDTISTGPSNGPSIPSAPPFLPPYAPIPPTYAPLPSPPTNGPSSGPNTPTAPVAPPPSTNPPGFIPPSDVSEPSAWFALLVIPGLLGLFLLTRKRGN